jgi:hypothetical protein
MIEEWMAKLLAGYPPATPAKGSKCTVCGQGKICRERAEIKVRRLARQCDATDEAVAHWIIEMQVDLTSIDADLIDWYQAYARRNGK